MDLENSDGNESIEPSKDVDVIDNDNTDRDEGHNHSLPDNSNPPEMHGMLPDLIPIGDNPQSSTPGFADQELFADTLVSETMKQAFPWLRSFNESTLKLERSLDNEKWKNEFYAENEMKLLHELARRDAEIKKIKEERNKFEDESIEYFLESRKLAVLNQIITKRNSELDENLDQSEKARSNVTRDLEGKNSILAKTNAALEKCQRALAKVKAELNNRNKQIESWGFVKNTENQSDSENSDDNSMIASTSPPASSNKKRKSLESHGSDESASTPKRQRIQILKRARVQTPFHSVSHSHSIPRIHRQLKIRQMKHFPTNSLV